MPSLYAHCRTMLLLSGAASALLDGSVVPAQTGDAWRFEGDPVAVSLTITAALPSGAVTQEGTQVLTFTFSRPVENFTAEDVQLSRAFLEDFMATSGTSYIATVRGVGGFARVDVAPAAATAVGEGIPSAPASFEFFYQDRVQLPIGEGQTIDGLRLPPVGRPVQAAKSGAPALRVWEIEVGSPPGEASRRSDEGPYQARLFSGPYTTQFEVSQANWELIMRTWPGSAPSVANGLGPSFPAYGLSWEDAQAFTVAYQAYLRSLGPNFTFIRVRLLTEAEWDSMTALEGGATGRFPFGDGFGSDEACSAEPERVAGMWYCGNASTSGAKSTAKALTYSGFANTSGNVAEWVSDWYAPLPSGVVYQYSGPATGTMKVRKGGAWNSPAADCRSAAREAVAPNDRSITAGFRVAWESDSVALEIETASGSAASGRAGSLSTRPRETVRFRFSHPVRDFTASDVVVVGGTATAFGAVGASEYTVEVTAAAEGEVLVAVDEGAALPVSNPTANPFIASQGAAMTYRFQDSPTILLPGGVPMEFARLPAGTFTMGSPVGETSRFDVEIPHAVTLTQNFYMARTEVTQRQWLALMGSWPGAAFNQVPSAPFGLGDDYPAYFLCWEDTQAFATALNQHIANSGQGPFEVRLPTEAEWEYACRAGTTTRFSFGEGAGADEACSAEPERIAALWYCGNNSPTGAKVVARKPANSFGLFDMHGNVFEWCQDYYGPYSASAQTNPTGPTTGSDRVQRGGSWGAQFGRCRSAQRFLSSPGAASRFRDSGFRLAASRP